MQSARILNISDTMSATMHPGKVFLLSDCNKNYKTLKQESYTKLTSVLFEDFLLDDSNK